MGDAPHRHGPSREVTVLVAVIVLALLALLVATEER